VHRDAEETTQLIGVVRGDEKPSDSGMKVGGYAAKQEGEGKGGGGLVSENKVKTRIWAGAKGSFNLQGHSKTGEREVGKRVSAQASECQKQKKLSRRKKGMDIHREGGKRGQKEKKLSQNKRKGVSRKKTSPRRCSCCSDPSPTTGKRRLPVLAYWVWGVLVLPPNRVTFDCHIIPRKALGQY